MEDDGRFTVKSMYKKLEGLMVEEGSISLECDQMFSRIWRNVVSSKVAAFSWKLHNRIPSKANQDHIQYLPPEASLLCMLCKDMVDSANHFFLHCPVAMKVWDYVMF